MYEFGQHISKYQQLLRELKTTVEGLLVSRVANVWLIYGGLNRLHCSVEKIFKHGCKSTRENSYLNFIQGLEWLHPDNTKSYFLSDCEYKANMPQYLKDMKASIWLYTSLGSHTLSQKLSWLLSDKNHLLSCYQEYAFLCQVKYAEAALICLRAVEQNQASLMTDIDPCLFLSEARAKDFQKIHRRCSSNPDHFKISLNEKTKSKCQKIRVVGKLKPWNSMPNLYSTNSIPIVSCSKTTPSTPQHCKKTFTSSLKMPAKKKKSNLKKSYTKKMTKHVVINQSNIVTHSPPLSSSQSSGILSYEENFYRSLNLTASPKLMDSFLPLAGEKDFRKPKKSFIEDGGLSVLPMATGYFPKPKKGQTLQSFLKSSQFARPNAELDRENAHFSISEAIISAMEQLRYRKDFHLTDEQLDDSDPEIMDLKQRIRLRRRQKLIQNQVWSELLTNEKTDTTTTVSPCSTTASSSTSSSEIDDIEINSTSTLADHQGVSVSMASLYSDADILKREAPDGASDIFSAEGVALSLISKFREKQLPRASDLQWIVSEDETPQTLLPMPSSWPVDEDDRQSDLLLRGTNEWAPPRPQIIFTVHRSPTRKILIAKQNYRCAGCSMKVVPQYSSKFRYCDYLGRYFCTGCHTNQLAIIPGRVIQKWDFSRYPVSTFSYRLLEQMYSDPLFRIFELNKHIWKLSSNLQLVRRYRTALFSLKDFIYNCRFAETIKDRLETQKPYILNDPDIYSLEDLVSIKNGDIKWNLKFLVETCCKHVSECQLCSARGFICEICNSSDVIFPWQLRKVRRCSVCGSCYHSSCWTPLDSQCKKCDRIVKRKEIEGNSSNDTF